MHADILNSTGLLTEILSGLSTSCRESRVLVDPSSPSDTHGTSLRSRVALQLARHFLPQSTLSNRRFEQRQRLCRSARASSPHLARPNKARLSTPCQATVRAVARPNRCVDMLENFLHWTEPLPGPGDDVHRPRRFRYPSPNRPMRPPTLPAHSALRRTGRAHSRTARRA